MSATCARAASSLPPSMKRPASSLFSVISDSECPSRSCRSRAIRSRSSEAARWATAARASRSSRMVATRRCSPVMAAPERKAVSAMVGMSPWSARLSSPTTTVSPAIAATPASAKRTGAMIATATEA